MSNKNFSHKAKPTSTFASTHSMKGTISVGKPHDIDHIMHPDFEGSNPVPTGLIDMRFNMEKCSNSADLPSTQNHKAGTFGEV
jgi:hypothetical protein